MDTRIPKELELVKLVNEGKQLGKRTWPQKLKYKEKVGAQIVAQVSAKDTTLWAGGRGGKNHTNDTLQLLKMNVPLNGISGDKLPIVKVHIDEEVVAFVTQRRRWRRMRWFL